MLFLLFLVRNHQFHHFISSDFSLFFNKVSFFHIDIDLPSFFLYFFMLRCQQHVATCFVFDLLKRIVVLSIISFFVVFTLRDQMVKFDPIESSY